ncbi:MAG: 50S ribosomal protein L22 [Candidatus Omnitrophica bacterium]|nr:50S ribosomal protein L22 [Candidatus Omnitrophota bacterium]
MITKATLRYIRISPRKVRPVIALIKGKKAEDAISALYGIKKRASSLLIDVIESAMSNARRMQGVDVSSLYVSNLIANGGPQMKRFRAGSMGRASTIRKRTSHITVELDTKTPDVRQAAQQAPAAEARKAGKVKVAAPAKAREPRAVKKPRAKEPAKSEHGKKGKE